MTEPHKSSKIVFSSDGIRGISGEWPFTKDGMNRIGEALSSFLLKKKVADLRVIIGRDTRPSGKEYVKALKKCFLRHNVEVLDLGIAPTPVVAYITKVTKSHLGVVISASHNPAKYNGIKLVDSRGLRLQPTSEKQIERLLMNAKLASSSIRKIRAQPQSKFKGLVKTYISEHIKVLGRGSLRGLKLVIDCSNGAVSRTGKRLLSGLGAEVTVLNNDLTGKRKINDNCGSEYFRRHPEKLIQIVKKKKSDYGFAFDGDGDRMVIVDSKGNFYDGDDLLFALAVYMNSIGKLPSSAVVITKNSNSALKKTLKRFGIKTITTTNGDKNLEAVIWKRDLLLGAEQVGNIIINDGQHGAADSLYSIALLCSILTLEEKTMEDVTSSFMKQPQISATVHVTQPLHQKDLNRLKNEERSNSRLSPSIRIEAWYSTTEPGVFNVMVEGSPTENLDHMYGFAKRFCLSVANLGLEKPRVFDLSSRKRLGVTK